MQPWTFTLTSPGIWSTTGKSNAGPARSSVVSAVTAESADARFGTATSPATAATKPKVERFIALLHLCVPQHVHYFVLLMKERLVALTVPYSTEVLGGDADDRAKDRGMCACMRASV